MLIVLRASQAGIPRVAVARMAASGAIDSFVGSIRRAIGLVSAAAIFGLFALFRTNGHIF